MAALSRATPIKADAVNVTINLGKVTISGRVDTDHDRIAAQSAAWSAPGVIQVEDLLTIN